MSRILSILLLLLCGARAALPAQASRPPRTGAFTERFDALHPMGRLKRQASRFKWGSGFLKKNGARELIPGKEKLRVVVPRHEAGDPPLGLLVWVSPGDTGHVPAEWLPVLAKRRIIAAGADRSGNERKIWDRVGLALAVVHHLQSRYRLDPRKIWIAGYSGGGRIASRVAFHYPEVFCGSYTMGGCNWWREIVVPGSKPRKVWPARFPPPTGSRLNQVKLVSRHVFMTGADDFNRDHVRGIWRDAKRRQGFRNTLYQELPGKGHVWAPAQALDEGLGFLMGEEKK